MTYGILNLKMLGLIFKSNRALNFYYFIIVSLVIDELRFLRYFYHFYQMQHPFNPSIQPLTCLFLCTARHVMYYTIFLSNRRMNEVRVTSHKSFPHPRVPMCSNVQPSTVTIASNFDLF